MITDHRFVGKREWGISPAADKPCQFNRYGHPSGECGHRNDEHAFNALHADPQLDRVLLTTENKLLRHELRHEHAQTVRWRTLAAHYDDIRYWLRLCEDTPAGHTEFYHEVAKLIFPENSEDRDEGDR